MCGRLIAYIGLAYKVGGSIKKILSRLSKFKTIIFLDQLLFRLKNHAVLAVGPQLSFFLILSLFPFIIVFLNLLSYTPLVREDVLKDLIYYLPLETQKIIRAFAYEITISSSQGLLSVAAITGLWTASSGIK
ncbi:MAG: hypothetical protein GX185_08515, partial [Tissierellia bacterium]|nr:hypothetical protein [Tissierellia bacterium]